MGVFGGTLGGTWGSGPSPSNPNPAGGGGFDWGKIDWEKIILAGLGTASSILNRPKKGKLDPRFLQILQQLQGLIAQGGKPATADPRELAGLLNRANQIGEGARTRTTKNIVGRGLGQSGILGEALAGIDTSLVPQLQWEAGSQALGLAENRQQRQISNQLSALGLVPPALPQGQSAIGAGVGGLAEMLAFLLAMGKNK